MLAGVFVFRIDQWHHIDYIWNKGTYLPFGWAFLTLSNIASNWLQYSRLWKTNIFFLVVLRAEIPMTTRALVVVQVIPRESPRLFHLSRSGWGWFLAWPGVRLRIFNGWCVRPLRRRSGLGLSRSRCIQLGLIQRWRLLSRGRFR